MFVFACVFVYVCMKQLLISTNTFSSVLQQDFFSGFCCCFCILLNFVALLILLLHFVVNGTALNLSCLHFRDNGKLASHVTPCLGGYHRYTCMHTHIHIHVPIHKQMQQKGFFRHTHTFVPARAHY